MLGGKPWHAMLCSTAKVFAAVRRTRLAVFFCYRVSTLRQPMRSSPHQESGDLHVLQQRTAAIGEMDTIQKR
jgi:hypothetical protein